MAHAHKTLAEMILLRDVCIAEGGEKTLYARMAVKALPGGTPTAKRALSKQFYNHLNKKTATPLSNAEERNLVNQVSKYERIDVIWTEVKELFPGRTANEIRDHARKLLPQQANVHIPTVLLRTKPR